jgi:hypothetical protein
MSGNMIKDGWHWMVLDDAFPIRQAISFLAFGSGSGLTGLNFSQKKSCIMVHTV